MYYLLIIAGGLMTMDTIWLSTVCNGNLGIALPAKNTYLLHFFMTVGPMGLLSSLS